MAIGPKPDILPDPNAASSITSSRSSKPNRGIPAKIQGLSSSRPPSETSSPTLLQRGSKVTHSPTSPTFAAKTVKVATPQLARISENAAPPHTATAAHPPQPAKPLSDEGLRIARETNWSEVEVTEDEAKAYLTNIDSHVLSKDSRIMMQSCQEIKLSNGKTLSPGEHAALKFYSQHGYSFVNAFLNNSPSALYRAANEMKITLKMPEMEKEILLHCKMACSALNKLPPSKNEEIYRGALLNREQLGKYTDALAKKESMSEQQILSTTTDIGVASRFVQIKRTRVEDRYNKELLEASKTGSPPPQKPDSIAVLFAIKHEDGGKEIHAFSNAPDELEATFVAGTTFKVANILNKDILPVEMRKVYEHVIILQKV